MQKTWVQISESAHYNPLGDSVSYWRPPTPGGSRQTGVPQATSPESPVTLLTRSLNSFKMAIKLPPAEGGRLSLPW